MSEILDHWGLALCCRSSPPWLLYKGTKSDSPEGGGFHHGQRFPKGTVEARFGGASLALKKTRKNSTFPIFPNGLPLISFQAWTVFFFAIWVPTYGHSQSLVSTERLNQTKRGFWCFWAPWKMQSCQIPLARRAVVRRCMSNLFELWQFRDIIEVWNTSLLRPLLLFTTLWMLNGLNDALMEYTTNWNPSPWCRRIGPKTGQSWDIFFQYKNQQTSRDCPGIGSAWYRFCHSTPQILTLLSQKEFGNVWSKQIKSSKPETCLAYTELKSLRFLDP